MNNGLPVAVILFPSSLKHLIFQYFCKLDGDKNWCWFTFFVEHSSIHYDVCLEYQKYWNHYHFESFSYYQNIFGICNAMCIFISFCFCLHLPTTCYFLATKYLVIFFFCRRSCRYDLWIYIIQLLKLWMKDSKRMKKTN